MKQQLCYFEIISFSEFNDKWSLRWMKKRIYFAGRLPINISCNLNMTVVRASSSLFVAESALQEITFCGVFKFEVPTKQSRFAGDYMNSQKFHK